MATRSAPSRALARNLRPELFKALADPTRIVLLCRLAAADGPLTVGEASNCCDVHLSGVSRHLAQLRAAGIVRAKRRGREVVYELDAAPLAGTLRALAEALENCCGGACCPPGRK